MRRTAPVLAALVGAAGAGIATFVSPAGSARWNEAAVALVIVAYATVGAVILWHQPAQPVGRIAVAMAALWGVGEALVATSYVELDGHPDARTAALGSVLGSTLRGFAWLVLVLWLPLRFPDGAGPEHTRLRRWAERVVPATIVVFVLVSLVSPELSDLRVTSIDNPIGLPHALTTLMGGFAGVALLMGAMSIALAVACLVQQYRHGGSLGRQQTLVFAMAFIPPVSAFAASVADAAGPWLFALATLPLPVAIGVAVLQRRLYDLPLVVNRSVTYGALWLAIAGLYAVTVGGVGAMLRQQGAAWLPWVAAGVVAVSFAPLRDALQRAANRLTYGQWSEPAEVLAATGRRLGDATDVPGLLATLVEDLGVGLGLPYVAITDPHGHTLVVHGVRPNEVEDLPMTAYGAPVGVLSWSPRRLRDADRTLLNDLAGQLGAVVHAAGLLTAVRAAQERLVIAREEERKRLRRDLHDGLGPALAGLTLQVDTLRNRLDRSEGAEAGLLRLRAGIQATVADVRRIVEGLRPPAIDELGLADAVAQLADGIAAGTDLAVVLEADTLPRLPAAVEVAAYRIVQEALTNVARHARASSAVVRLTLSPDAPSVEVCDDGVGQIAPRADGVGLGSMRERAEEIAGRFTLTAMPGRGTTVMAILPVTGQVNG